jgi:hypothetical protein
VRGDETALKRIKRDDEVALQRQKRDEIEKAVNI